MFNDLSLLESSGARETDSPFSGRFNGPGWFGKKRKTGNRNDGLDTQLAALAGQDIQAALTSLESSLSGLTHSEASIRKERYGPNNVVEDKQAAWMAQLFRAFWTPFSLLLSFIAAVSILTNDFATGLIISAMVLLSVALTFIQEYRASQAAEKLRTLVTTTATVYRSSDSELGGQRVQYEIPLSDLVPGDIIHLSAGDMIPADVRLLTSKDLFVSQSSLTGEALPVEKSADGHPGSGALLDMMNLGFMGTTVISGTADALVVKTGHRTYFGSLAGAITEQRIPGNFDKGIHQFTWLMLRFMMFMAPAVFLINGLGKGDWLQAFLFAISIAVGLTPEMLPMIVTVNMAKGALAMSRKKVIVKRLNAIQNFGAIDILCTDKTGTLTQDRVTLEKYLDPLGKESSDVLKFTYLNSFYQSGLKNLLDKAVLTHVEVDSSLKPDTRYRKIDEIPFDFERRRMSVVVEEEGSKKILICKGAVEEMFKACTRVKIGDDIAEMTGVLRRSMENVVLEMNQEGLRIIAVAIREVQESRSGYGARDESDLILVGFVGFLDPPKETAAQVIQDLQRAGVRVIVLTGDNEVVTRKVCKAVGLPNREISFGHEIDALDDAALSHLAESTHIFAKLTPSLKERVIRALQRNGHVVGFLGDGINDAAALKAADVGVSVDTAVDIAKESADIILLEKSLLVLADGVIEGRKVFSNIIKYIKMGASSNFGNVFSVVGASLLLPFLPMLPVQLLVQNLLYDFSQTAIPFDRVDREYLATAHRWKVGMIERFMIYLGPVSSVFDYATFGLMWFHFGAHDPKMQGLFQSGWFVEGLLSQTLIVHMIRTPKIPFIESRASWPLLLTTAAVMGAGVWIPYSALGSKLGFAPLPIGFFPWLAAILLGYCLLAHLVKRWFVQRFGFS